MRKTSAQKHCKSVTVRLEFIINYILKQLEEAKKRKHDDKHINADKCMAKLRREFLASLAPTRKCIDIRRHSTSMKAIRDESPTGMKDFVNTQVHISLCAEALCLLNVLSITLFTSLAWYLIATVLFTELGNK